MSNMLDSAFYVRTLNENIRYKGSFKCSARVIIPVSERNFSRLGAGKSVKINMCKRGLAYNSIFIERRTVLWCKHPCGGINEKDRIVAQGVRLAGV